MVCGSTLIENELTILNPAVEEKREAVDILFPTTTSVKSSFLCLFVSSIACLLQLLVSLPAVAVSYTHLNF